MNGRTDEARSEFTGARRRRTFAVLLATCVAVSTACDSGRIVNTDDARPTLQTSATAVPLPAPRGPLANAFDYAAQPAGQTGYFFTSPSQRWVCAIIPRERVGCQSSTGSRIAITGAPDAVVDAQGDEVAPNAIQLDRTNDAQFVVLDPPGYSLMPGPAAVLPFDVVLTVAGFRCNVQEATGISCLSELSGRGFTFSTDGYTLQYSDLPA